MSDCVPDFGMDDDYSIPTSSELSRPRKSSMAADDEIMELLWQNGQVVMQSQNHQRNLKKSPHLSQIIIEDTFLPDEHREIRTSSAAAPPSDDLFMHEDEMASWLHYPLDDTSFDRDLCSDFLYQAPSVSLAAATIAPPITVRTNLATAAKPPIPPSSNFVHFSRMKGNFESGPSNLNKIVRESTVVDSNDTPAIMKDFARVSQLGTRTCEIDGAGRAEMVTCDITVTSSSPGGSGASFSARAEPTQKPPAEDQKRKAQQAADEADCYSEDVEFEPSDAKKTANGSSSTKRSRAAEVHNLSERRRRDRINEKMRALQELIPRCNKSDKASMLDEAIEYLKSLQMQVQMMSMGCSMVPMMYPGAQHYMPPMGMGLGMGMGMDMSMSRPIMPFPSILAGSAMPTPSAAAHLGPRFPMPAYHMQPVPAPDPSRIQTSQQSDHMINPHTAPNLNQTQLPNFVDPYQRYLGLHQMQFPLPQNQSTDQPGTGKPSTQ